MDGLTSLDERSLKVSLVAGAALSIGLSSWGRGLSGALGSLADKFALGTRAVGGLGALPVALGLLAHGGADGVGSNA